MFRRLVFLALLCTLSGCGPVLDQAESSLLYNIAQDIEGLKGEYPELSGFSADSAVTNRNYFSYIKKTNEEALIMNSGVYWFKVSLTKKAVDMMDSPQPVLSVEMTPMHKHLHLRVRGKDMALTKALAAIVLEHGTIAGGTQRVLELQNSVEVMPRGRGRGMR